MNIVTVALMTIIIAILALTIKKYHPEFAIVVSLAACVFILIGVLSNFLPILDKINTLAYKAGINSDYIVILIKCLGICIVCQLASDICKDAGETALSSKVELAGKIAILLLALPLFEQIGDMAISLINK